MSSDGAIASNKFGQIVKYKRRKLGSIYDVEEGMHVSFDEHFFHHHAIVSLVYYDADTIVLIEYGNDLPSYFKNFTKGLNKAAILERALSFGKQDIYQVLHEFSLPAEIVVERAYFRFGEEDYNLVSLNCEHFANWCVEGEVYSEQVNQAVGNVKASVGKMGLQTGAMVSAQVAKAALTSSAKTASKAVTGAGAVVGAAVEIGLMSHDIHKAVKGKEENEITQRQFEDAVGKRVGKAATNIAGATAGAVIGQALIPVPVVGAVVGGAVGSLLGLGVGVGLAEAGVKIRDAIEKDNS